MRAPRVRVRAATIAASRSASMRSRERRSAQRNDAHDSARVCRYGKIALGKMRERAPRRAKEARLERVDMMLHTRARQVPRCSMNGTICASPSAVPRVPRMMRFDAAAVVIDVCATRCPATMPSMPRSSFDMPRA